MEGNQTDEYIHRHGSAIANGIEGSRIPPATGYDRGLYPYVVHRC